MSNYVQTGYDYAKANALTSDDIRDTTRPELRAMCGVTPATREDFKARAKTIRRRITQRLSREERAVIGEADRLSLRTAARTVFPNATVVFVSAQEHVTIDGPAFVVRRGA